MARRRSAPAPRRAAAPAPRPAPTAVASKPAAAVAPTPVVVQGQSMLGNIASTAAGVAIGHTAGHMLTGAFSGGSSQPVAPVEAGSATPAPMAQQSQQTPCQYELQQFLNCSQTQPDLSLCEGFNQMLKECKIRYQNPSGF